MIDKQEEINKAVRLVLDAVEFDDERAMLYITMPGHEYGFEMDEKIYNPLAEAIVLLAAAWDMVE